MTKVWHWLVFGAVVLYSWPVVLQFGDAMSGEAVALFGMLWFGLLVVAITGAWSTLVTGWQEDVKIERWKRSGMFR